MEQAQIAAFRRAAALTIPVSESSPLPTSPNKNGASSDRCFSESSCTDNPGFRKLSAATWRGRDSSLSCLILKLHATLCQHVGSFGGPGIFDLVVDAARLELSVFAFVAA